MTLSPSRAPSPPASGSVGGPAPHSAVPSDEEMAAIMAAVEVAWPRPAAAAGPDDQPGPWRFSGRWWSKPHTVQRVRPWVERG